MKYPAGTAVLLTIIVTGTWLRFHNLGADSLWLDEAITWWQSKDTLADVFRRTAQDTYPPLHNVLINGSIRMFGDREWALRLPSAVLGTANILAIYWLGTLTVGRFAALAAAGFLALSGFHIWYSQEARMYSLLALTATVYAASSLYFVRSPTISRAAVMGASGLGLLYSHVFGSFNWIAIAIGVGLFTCVGQGRTALDRKWLIANAVSAITFAPWAWLLLEKAMQIREGGFWTPYPSSRVIYAELYALFGGRLVGLPLLIGIILAAVPHKRTDITTSLRVLAGWAALPIFLAYLVSLVSTPVFVSRYLIGSLPAIMIIGSYGLTRFAGGWRAATLVGATVAAVLIFSYFRYTTTPREDWRALAAMLETNLGPSDCLIVDGNVEPLAYYYRKEIACLSVMRNISRDMPYNFGSRLYVVSSYRFSSQADRILNILGGHGWFTRQQHQIHGLRVMELTD